MLLTKPAYFDDFRCIVGDCPDSCCKEWDVQVDEDAAALYRSLPGALGDRLRQVLSTDEYGDTVMTIVDGRCPMWREDGLCRIQAEQGEAALCHTCREFPRLTHDYGNFMEKGLELSCPEAARLILSAKPAPFLTEEIPGGEEPEYDEEAMACLKASREKALALLETDLPIGDTLALLLLYGYQAQGELDGEEEVPFDPDAAMASVRQFRKDGNMTQILEFFRDLEILQPDWASRLAAPAGTALSETCRPLARYFVQRYWLQAVSDYDLACRVKFILVSCLVISALGGDFLTTAQRYSKEIENNTDNVEALLEAAYRHSAFTDDKLLGLLTLKIA